MLLSDVHLALTDPPAESRPQMRWWWFGPDVSRDDADRQLVSMAAAGIGGVEVAFVYPLRPGSPEFLSAESLAVLRYAAERARELGLRFHLTLGSGWSFGGAHIAPEHAAQGLVWERRSVQPGAHRLPVPASWPGERVVAAALMRGEVAETLRDLVPLEIEEGMIHVPDGRGPRVVVLGIVRPTGQVVKRAAAGADGPVLDHYSAAATRAHLEHVGGALLDAVPADLIESLFCDSLEAYGANWTTDLPEEFARRRGYAFDKLLHLLVVDVDALEPGADRERVESFRADFYRTLSELYEERFVAECQRWCAERGLPFRIQGYGVPPARIGSYRFADRYEGEGWGWKTLTATRWASSAAHVDGVPVVSCESWTWIHSPSFRATPLDLRGEAHEHLLSGVNELIGHGWPHSPQDADGIGWFFYAAGALDDRNPWWPAMPELMRELQRLCAILRLGDPVRDVLVYAPYDDAAKRLGQTRDGAQNLDLFRATRDQVPAGLIATIRETGRDFDLFDDTMVDRIALSRGQVVVVAGADRVPVSTRRWLDRVRESGGAVLAIDAPGVAGENITVGEVPDAIQRYGSAISGLVRPDGTVGVVRRSSPSTDIHVVMNTGPAARPFRWEVRSGRARVEYWSADTGRRIAPESLLPYQAIVVVETDEPDATKAVADVEQVPNATIALDAGWNVAFPGRPPVDVTLPHCWEDDAELRHYSGGATYTIRCLLPRERVGRRVELDLGRPSAWDDERIRANRNGHSYRVFLNPPVGEIAEVRINGARAGVVWAPPYRVDVSELIREGENVIELTVHNTAANALALDAAPARSAESVLAWYGKRFEFQELDHAMDDVRSGLFGPVSLRFG